MSPPRENVQGCESGRETRIQKARGLPEGTARAIAEPPKAGQATMACSAARHYALSAATNQLIRTLKIGRCRPKRQRPHIFREVKNADTSLETEPLHHVGLSEFECSPGSLNSYCVRPVAGGDGEHRYFREPEIAGSNPARAAFAWRPSLVRRRL